MDRRQFLIAQSLLLLSPSLVMANSGGKVQTLSGAMVWLDILEKSPVPGAPPLGTSNSWQTSLLRLRRAIMAFEAHTGELKPHFAYGALSKRDFAQAHVFHIANHQDEIVLSALA
jgi:hypothetical protein